MNFESGLRRMISCLALSLVCTAPALAACDNSGGPGGFPFSDEKALAKFVVTLQAAVAKNGKEEVAALMEYPVRVKLDGKNKPIARKLLLERYDDIFTAKVRSAIKNARFQSVNQYDCVFWNSQGVMFGAGEVWLNESGKGKIGVMTINN